MYSTEEYRGILASMATSVRSQSAYDYVALADARGRFLGKDVRATHPSPRFDNSQMDGYALADHHLRVAGCAAAVPLGPTVAAGADPSTLYPQGIQEAVAPVMTGARLPAGTVAVVPVERCEPDTFEAAESQGIRFPSMRREAYCRRVGSDIAAGETLLRRGTELTPLALGALASQGVKDVPVVARPRVVICTGGAEIGGTGVASIPDANGPLLEQLCADWGLDVIGRIHTDDAVEPLRSNLQQAVRNLRPDLIITSGGISHGRYEVVRLALEGITSWFGHVAQQPGGPQGYSVLDGVPVVCLPGNPISTVVSFRMIVAPVWSPALSTDKPGEVAARLEEDVANDSAVPHYRRGYLRVSHDATLRAAICGGISSHLIAQAADATCLIRIPPKNTCAAGDTVAVYPLRGTL